MSELRKLTASDGMFFTNGDVYGKEIYLGIFDSPDNWHEITDEEYAEILAKQEAELEPENRATDKDYQEALRAMGVQL